MDSAPKHVLDGNTMPLEFLLSLGPYGVKILSDCLFRGVSVEKLNTVLKLGIDVEPTDAVIFTDVYLEKVWEYGGWPKIVLALSRDGLQRTFEEISSDTSEEKLAEMRARFPTMLTPSEGKMLRFSRLAESDSRLASVYETEYARWIPGDPLQVLKMIMIFE